MEVNHLKIDLLHIPIERDLIDGLISSIPRESEQLRGRFPVWMDRWILASALQKCIRRGLREEALEVAIALHEVDPEYAWRRLRVIAFEDVGMGDIESVARIVSIAGKRKLRNLVGDSRTFVSGVQSLTSGAKDRTACDLLSWIGCSPEGSAFRTALLSTPSCWEAVALDGECPVWQRVMALQLLAGHVERTRAGYRTITRANSGAIRRVVEALEPHPLVTFAVLRGRGTESLNIALLFAYLLREQASRRPMVSHEIEARSVVRIGGVIAPSFCMYTRVGLRALRMLLHRDAELRDMLAWAGATDAFRALGFLVFQVESGVLDLVEDYAPKVRIDAERAELAQFGIADDAVCATLRMLLRDHIPLLNRTRRAAWNAHLAEVKSSGELA